MLRIYRLSCRLSDFLVWLLEAISTLALMFIVFSFGWLVFGRYVLNSTPTWVEHVTILLIALVTFVMMAVNQRRGKNLAVGILTDRMPERPRAFVLSFIDGLVVLFGIVCAVYGVRLGLFNAGQRIPILGISEGIRMIPLVLGGAVMAFFSLLNAVERFMYPTTPQDDEGAPQLDATKLQLGEH